MRKINKNSQSLYDWCKENEKDLLLEEWDYQNNEFSPKEYSRASKESVNWICSECNTHFAMMIQNRTLCNSGCQKCSAKKSHDKERMRRIKEKGSLAEKNPQMLKKWNYEKNKGISPYEVSPKSTIKVWWKCPTCNYEFESRIVDVKASNGCIKCKGNKDINIGRDGKYAVYIHICPNSKVYIGCTGSPLKIRFGNGKNYSKESPFGKAIKVFGWDNIEHKLLEYGLTKEEALNKEKEYIKLYKATNEQYGYNVSEGGAGNVVAGKKMSEETKRKIADSNRGKFVSNETREKLRKTHLGQISHHTTAVIKMDMKGNFIEEYVSIAEAIRNNSKVDTTSIWRCCTNKANSAGGYKWKYKYK